VLLTIRRVTVFTRCTGVMVIDDPSVVISTVAVGARLRRSRIGLSMMIA